MELYSPAGTAGDDQHSLYVDPERAGWDYSGLRVVDLAADVPFTFTTGNHEMAVLPLHGNCTVEVEDRSFALDGRDGIFAAVTDFAYVPIDAEVRLSSAAPAEIALCTALARRRIDPYYVAAHDVAIEVRGGGYGTRQINNFLSADVNEADQADRRRGAHTTGQLVVLPAPQARRGFRRRGRAGRDLLLPHRRAWWRRVLQYVHA